MQLVTRLLLKMLWVSAAMLVVAMALTLISAKRDIADEVGSSQRVGRLLATLSALQENAPISEQVTAINALNEGNDVRHFHVTLQDANGQRLTRRPPESKELSSHFFSRWWVGDQSLTPSTLNVVRPDGQRLVLILEPHPQSESAEAMTAALFQLGLFAAIALGLVVALWFSLRTALAPLSTLLSGIARLQAGDYQTRIARSGTRELNQIGQALNHLAAALAEQIAKQRELLHRLQQVQEDERRKLAHELHDEFGQLLTAIQVDASYMQKQASHQPELQACAQAMYANSSSILEQLRGLLSQLRPYGLQDGEEHDIALEQALQDLVNQRRMRDASALDCHLLINLAQQSIPQPLAVAVYRITQEALTNVLKHAHATRVEIRLIVDLAQSTLSLSVADDGIGLAPEPTDASDAAVKPLAVHPGSGLGMVGIRERVLAQQGVLTLSANEPHGFKLRACFPIALSQST